MIKIILSFLFVFGLFFFGIKSVRAMTGMQKWDLAKLVLFSLVCTALTTLALIGLVLVF